MAIPVIGAVFGRWEQRNCPVDSQEPQRCPAILPSFQEHRWDQKVRIHVFHSSAWRNSSLGAQTIRAGQDILQLYNWGAHSSFYRCNQSMLYSKHRCIDYHRVGAQTLHDVSVGMLFVDLLDSCGSERRQTVWESYQQATSYKWQCTHNGNLQVCSVHVQRRLEALPISRKCQSFHSQNTKRQTMDSRLRQSYSLDFIRNVQLLC